MQNLFSWFCHVKNCPRKNIVSWSHSLTYHDQNYPDHRSGLRIRIHDGIKIDQDLPNPYADNFSRDKMKNNNSALWHWFDLRAEISSWWEDKVGSAAGDSMLGSLLGGGAGQLHLRLISQGCIKLKDLLVRWAMNLSLCGIWEENQPKYSKGKGNMLEVSASLY